MLLSAAVLALFAPTVHLEVDDRTGGACPTSTALHKNVVALLGRDPFQVSGRRIKVTIDRAGDGFHATIVDGAGQRQIPAGVCSELIPAVALAVAIAVDPVRGLVPEPIPPAASQTAAASVPSPSLEADPTAFEYARRPLNVVLHSTFHAAAGASPAVGLGGALGVHVGRGQWSAGAEFRLDATSMTSFRDGEVGANWIGGRALGCLRGGFLDACATFAVARQSLTGAGFPVENEGSGLYLAPGVRGVIRVPFARLWSVRAQLDFDVPLSRTTLRVDGARAWQSSPVTGVLGVGLEFALSGGPM